VVVGAGYLVINTLIGNVLEPRMMGRKLGLSGLVVFLSLVFWGFVWGPVGMFLSVPLTMLVKILLEQSDDLRWIAIMLGPGGEDLRRPDPPRDLSFESQSIDLGDLDLTAADVDASQDTE
jgi:predicted PurR-regulated permease PerM